MSTIHFSLQARQVIKSAVFLGATLVCCVIYTFIIAACFQHLDHEEYFHSWDSGFENKQMLVIDLPTVIGTIASLIPVFWLLFKVFRRKWPVGYLLALPVYVLIWFVFICIMGGQSMSYFL